MWAVLANEITGLVYPRRSVCQPVKDEQGKPEAPDPEGSVLLFGLRFVIRYPIN